MVLNQDFVQMLERLMPGEGASLCRVLAETPPGVSVRVNGAKGGHVPPEASRVPWCETGFYLSDRPAFTYDPMLHVGAYYVQDASSMFLAHVLKNLIDTPVRYLDLCAAPGGKTTVALDALPHGSLVVANEVNRNRAAILCDNVTRWGNPDVAVTCDTPARLGQQLPGRFDIIAADMPCSGEGMMRKDAEAVTQWSPALVSQCAARQRDIIRDIWPALRQGGLFVYSTCTFNRMENEDIIEHLVKDYGAAPVSVPVDDAWNISPGIDCDLPCCRFMPHRTRGEGLFVAVVRKPGNAPAGRCDAQPHHTPLPKQLPTRDMQNWLASGEDYHLSMTGDMVTAIPKRHLNAMETLRGKANVLRCGVPLCTLKGKDAQPHHALALAAAANLAALPHIEISHHMALDYLYGNPLRLSDAPMGHLLLTHNGTGLGWVKNLGNRANNLYPKWLRIRVNKGYPDVNVIGSYV